MDQANIQKSVICNIATNPRQMKNVNDFAIMLKRNKRLIPLGSVNPYATLNEITTELERLKEAGIPGIKIHPDYMGVELDAEQFSPIFRACTERNMLVITHAGYDPVQPSHMHCTPDMVLRVIDRHPALKLVIAHAGGFSCEREALDRLCGAPIWLDTSLCALRNTRPADLGALCADILLSHDPSRVLFATDTPWSDPASELRFIENLGLSHKAAEGILEGNAKTLLASCGWDF